MQRYLVSVMLASAVLIAGCITNRPGDAPQAYLEPAAWLDSTKVLQGSTFQEYASAVNELLIDYRVPFDQQQAALEIKLASPVQVNPASHCGKQQAKGIVILVHGLSDTAFSMHDLATFFATRCYVARTALLPGHGTRAGDLLVTRLDDWLSTVRYLVSQAALENDNVLVAGFSLGAVLTLSVALEPDSPVDAVMAFSPAYSLSTYRLARLAPWLYWAKPWIDRGLPDDYARYEAMPTRGVAETVKAMQRLKRQLKQNPDIEIPWMLVQSMDDAVTLPPDNMALLKRHARHPASRVLNFHSDLPVKNDASTTWLSGYSESLKVVGITHLGVHISPDNPHYGPNGDYRNCGQTAGRDKNEVALCLSSESVWYGLWNKPSPPGEPAARSTFNPDFSGLTRELTRFLDDVE